MNSGMFTLAMVNYTEFPRKITFKIILEKIRIFGAYLAGWTGVTRITNTLGSIDTAPMAITHFFTLGANVDIINGPRHWLRASRIKSLVPSETHRSGKEVQVKGTMYLQTKRTGSVNTGYLQPVCHTQEAEHVIFHFGTKLHSSKARILPVYFLLPVRTF